MTMHSAQPSLRNNSNILLMQIAQSFPVLAGGLLFGLAALIFISKTATTGLVPPNDAVLGMSRDTILLILAAAALATSLFCFFTRNAVQKLLLTAWLATALATYRIGLRTMDSNSLAAFWGPMADAFGLSPYVFDVLIQGMFSLLLLGSYALLISAWLTKGKILAFSLAANKQAREYKLPCPVCRGNIKFAAQNIGQTIPCPHCQTNITLRKPDEGVKMSCYFCKEHIEFPAHAAGEKLKCPHCNKDITLKEPAHQS